MKCSKCGYLGFETTDRCRNCGYDFSLTSPGASAELPLRSGGPDGPLVELSLQNDATEVTEDNQAEPTAMAALAAAPSDHLQTDTDVPALHPGRSAHREVAPLVSPPPAGNPLAVRRATGEAPRRRSGVRPTRTETPVLPLAAGPEESATVSARDAAVRRDTGATPAGWPRRLGAALIDLVILGGISAGVLTLTLRIAGLELSVDHLVLIRPIPMAAFLLLLAFLYLAGFTIGGGQTIGKMVCGVRVIGDDGGGVDAAGAVVRSLGWLLTAGTLGLLFVPALFHADRRAPHDRLAGTRVVDA
jgi:uncharacterized RDD family membrane protein YckC